jgi:hypothetical protein
MAGLSSFYNLSEYLALVTMVPHSWYVEGQGLESPKTLPALTSQMMTES